MLASEILTQAKRLIAKKKNWTQGKYQDGDKFCMLGSLIKASGGDAVMRAYSKPPILVKAEEYLSESVFAVSAESVISYNDNPQRRHSDVLDRMRVAISLAKRAEKGRARK